MNRVSAIAVVWIALAAVCGAETRWCSITEIGHDANIFYPPMARVAQVYGVVLERVIYLPSGAVQSFEFVSGPRMLSAGLELQMKDWILQTNATGDALCQSLVIADFRLDDSSGQSRARPIDVTVPSVLRLAAFTTPVCLCDPGGVFEERPIVMRVGRRMKHVFASMFRTRR